MGPVAVQLVTRLDGDVRLYKPLKPTRAGDPHQNRMFSVGQFRCSPKRQRMIRARLTSLALVVVLGCSGISLSCAQDLKITLPRHSDLTPVQRLNRDGVDAVRKLQYERAESLFYKAYLYDPSDPFTLNNLGYIAELQGQLDRAQNFYKLAAEQGTNAFVDVSNEKEPQGKRMSYAL